MSKSTTSKRMADKPVANHLAALRNARNAMSKASPQPASKGSTAAVTEDPRPQHLSTVIAPSHSEDPQKVNQYRDQLRISMARQLDMLAHQMKDTMLQTKDPDKFDKIVRLIDDTYTRFSGLL